MSQTRTKQILGLLGSATAQEVAEYIVRQGDAESVSSCYGYVHRDLLNLKRYGEVTVNGSKVWTLAERPPS